MSAHESVRDVLGANMTIPCDDPKKSSSSSSNGSRIFLLLVQPLDLPAKDAARGQRYNPHFYTLHSNRGFLAHDQRPTAGHSFFAYGHHDLNVPRATAIAATVGASASVMACRLKDVPADGIVYLCAAASAPAPARDVAEFWICRPAGKYERMEDFSAESLPAYWGEVPWLGGFNQEAPRRRLRLRVERVGPGAELPQGVRRLAQQLLAVSDAQCRRRERGGEGDQCDDGNVDAGVRRYVPWGTLYGLPRADETCQDASHRRAAQGNARSSQRLGAQSAEKARPAPAERAVVSAPSPPPSRRSSREPCGRSGVSMWSKTTSWAAQAVRIFGWCDGKRTASALSAKAAGAADPIREPAARPRLPREHSLKLPSKRSGGGSSTGPSSAAAPGDDGSAQALPAERDVGMQVLCAALERMGQGRMQRLGLEDAECAAALKAGAKNEGRFGRVYPMGAAAGEEPLLLKLFKPARSVQAGGSSRPGEGGVDVGGSACAKAAPSPAGPALAPLLEMFHLLRCRKIRQVSARLACTTPAPGEKGSGKYTADTCWRFRGGAGGYGGPAPRQSGGRQALTERERGGECDSALGDDAGRGACTALQPAGQTVGL